MYHSSTHAPAYPTIPICYMVCQLVIQTHMYSEVTYGVEDSLGNNTLSQE